MAAHPLNWFAAAGPWSARAEDGGPSVELALAADPDQTRFGTGPSLRLTATADAEGHRIERAFPAEDLTALDALRFWVLSTRPADGKPGRPLYLELSLGSAALGLDAPGNTWRRQLPVPRAGAWELVEIGLGDLPAAVRGAASAIRLTCVDESFAFTARFDAAVAVREEPVRDVEAALVARFGGVLVVEGEAVSAAVAHATSTAPPAAPAAAARPHLRIRHVGIEGVSGGEARVEDRPRDFTGDGFALGATYHLLDLLYAFDVFADVRAQEAAVLEALVAAFAPRGELVVAGVPAPVTWESALTEALAGERVSPRIRVRVKQTRRPARPVVPVEDVTLTIEQPAG